MTNSRITKITLENFKGIGERTEIPIAPLTLLFGGNSAGKSTILHAIAYADEVLRNQNCNVNTTRLGGESLRLGGFYEIVHKHDLNATIKMRFDLNMDKFDEYEDFLIKKLNIVPKARNDSDMQDNAEKGGKLLSEVFRENVNKWIDQEIGGNIKSAWVELEIGYSAKYDPTKKLGPMVLSYNIGLNDEWFAEVGMCSWKEACGGKMSVTRGKRECFPGILKKINYLHPAIIELDLGISGDFVGFIDTFYRELLPSLDQFYFSNEPHSSLTERYWENRETLCDIVKNKGGLLFFLEELPELSWKSTETDASAFDIRIFPRKYHDVTTGQELNYEHWLHLSYKKGCVETVALVFRREDGWNENLTEQAQKEILAGSDLAASYEQAKVVFPEQDGALPFHDNIYRILMFWDSELDASDDSRHYHLLAMVRSGQLAFLEQVFRRLLYTPVSTLRDSLSAFRYVGPIREILPWEYVPSRISKPGRWANGLGGWDALSAPFNPLHESVTDWLGSEDKINTGYALQVRDIREISEELQNRLLEATPEQREELRKEIEKFEEKRKIDLIDLKKGNVAVHPQNVGVGISQLIPVLAAVLDQNSIADVLLEQPELHLHATQQAAVGDLLIHGCKKLHKTIIAETHSIHLVLRVLGGIRRSPKRNDKDFLAKDLKLLFIQSADGSTVIEEIKFNDDGKLIDSWPDNLFEQEYIERFN